MHFEVIKTDGKPVISVIQMTANRRRTKDTPANSPGRDLNKEQPKT